MKKNPKIFLLHISESIEEIEKYLGSVSEDEFSSDTKTQDAVMRRLEIIGEAAKNIPTDFQKQYQQIEWREIAGMRDQLIHHYFGVKMDAVWETAKKDLPKLKTQVSGILESL